MRPVGPYARRHFRIQVLRADGTARHLYTIREGSGYAMRMAETTARAMDLPFAGWAR